MYGRLTSPGFEAPARFGREKREQGSEEKTEIIFTWKGPSTECGSRSGGRGRTGFCKAGGPKGQAAAIPGTRVQMAGPPVHRRTSSQESFCLTLDSDFEMVKPATTSKHQEQREPAAREDREDFAADAPRGDCEAPEGGFSQRFPPARGGLRTSASPPSHRTNRRWAATVAAAQP